MKSYPDSSASLELILANSHACGILLSGSASEDPDKTRSSSSWENQPPHAGQHSTAGLVQGDTHRVVEAPALGLTSTSPTGPVSPFHLYKAHPSVSSGLISLPL